MEINNTFNECLLLDNVPFGICITDDKYNVLYINNTLEKWIGIKKDELINTSLLVKYPHLMEARYKKRLEMVLRESTPVIFSAQLQPHFLPSFLPDGTLMFHQTTVTLIKGKGNNDKKLCITIEDMTEPLKQLNIINELRKKTLQEVEGKKALIRNLQEALDKIKTLQGLIPICSNCKKIRDDKGYWTILETYLIEHSDAEFTHGLCPDCVQKLYPDLDKE